MSHEYIIRLKCTYEGTMEAIINAESEEDALGMLETYLQAHPLKTVNRWLLMKKARVVSVEPEPQERKH